MKTFLIVLTLLLLLSSIQCTFTTPSDQLTSKLSNLVTSRSLRGLQIQITKSGEQLYYNNFGNKNQRNNTIDKNTIFRIASLSKSFSSVSIMQLVQQKKLNLNDTLSKIFGYEVINPNYPNIDITVQMVLSHQSSIAQTDTEYNNFLMDSYNAIDGYSVPALKEILSKEGKYYNPKMFPIGRKPGEYYHYSNLNYVIAGTIVEKISGVRFDLYQQENILTHISYGLVENATYNVGKVKDYRNLATLYVGNNGKWVPDCDNYNDTIKQRNLTGYVIGKNGAVFGPQGGLRASVSHLNNYMYFLMNKGITKTGIRVLSQQSITQILKPRYQYHGLIGGSRSDYQLYGLGLYTTSMFPIDNIIDHQVVRGHTGSAYGLISGHYFWKNYTFAYIINGALYGYKYGTGTIYEAERMTINKAISDYFYSLQQQIQDINNNNQKIIIKNLVAEE